MDRNIKIDNLIKVAVANSLDRRQQSLALNSPIQNFSDSDNEALVDFAEIRGGISFIRTMGMIRK
jgi:hypothetical protein